MRILNKIHSKIQKKDAELNIPLFIDISMNNIHRNITVAGISMFAQLIWNSQYEWKKILCLQRNTIHEPYVVLENFYFVFV